MKTILKTSALLLFLSLTLAACKKDTKDPEPVAPEDPYANTGSLQVEFEGMVGDSALVLSTKTYTNAAGNTFNVTLYKYYISNIKLTMNDNTVWSESDSYHLIDYADPNSTTISIAHVPYGTYKAIEFMIGVDSTRNVSGAQSGALDPANGMFWSWSSGYIMAKMEGTSPQSTATANKLTFHIGGFSGATKVLKTVSPSFGSATADVSSSITPKIHMANNLLEWFDNPSSANVNFGTLNTIHMPGSNAKTISDNYADMFTVEHIHN